mgnify:CR=1 FL=1
MSVSEMLVSEIYIFYICGMKFYNREKEIKKLLEIKEQSKNNAQFSVVTGRRRIGKTQLLLKSYENTKFLYFFVAKLRIKSKTTKNNVISSYKED